MIQTRGRDFPNEEEGNKQRNKEKADKQGKRGTWYMLLMQWLQFERTKEWKEECLVGSLKV